MAKKKEDEINFDLMEDLNKEFNLMTETEQIHFKNPVLNGLFYNEHEDKNGKKIETWGIPKRSVIQFVAESGVGKSTLTLLMSKELLEQGYNIAYIDTEKGVNSNTLRSIGIDKFVQNKNPKKGGYFTTFNETDCDKINTLIQKLAETKIFQFIVIDSIGAMDSGLYKLGAGSVDNQKVGGDSKAIKAVLKTINSISASTGITFILINHLMQTIGTYIPQEKILGGRATEYLTDVIIELKKKGGLFRNDKNDKIPIGQKVEYEIRKSRYGRGKCPISFYIMYGKGIAMIPTLKDMVEEIKVSYQGNRVPLVEIRGGGNGSMFINDQEIKFKGELQLLNLISQYYNDIIKLVSPKNFAAKLPDSKRGNTWYETELAIMNDGKIFKTESGDIIDIETGEILEDEDDGVFRDVDDDLTGEMIDDE